MRYWIRPLGFLMLACAIAGCELMTDDDPVKKPDQPKSEKPAVDGPRPPTHKVEKGPFKIEVTLKGVFEAQTMTEIAIRPEAWNPQSGGVLMMRKVIEHGALVNKGEPILWLDTEKLDQTIRDMENERQLQELAIKQAEEELPLLEKATPQDLAAAERAKRIADEDLKRFLEIERDFAVKAAHQMVKNYTNYLDYAKEELRQLEKMYRAKDLTEETEEIILRRQKNQVESITFYLRMVEMERDELVKVTIPRRDQFLHDNAVKQTLNLDRARTVLPTTVSQKRLALAKMKYEREKANERLTKLKRDRDNLTVKAPVDGIVYHGKCVRGQWQSGGVAERLRAGAMLQADEILLTIVQRQPVFVRAEVEEKDLQHLQPGAKGKATPATAPDSRLPVKVERVSHVPVGPGKFDARLSIEVGSEASTLMPGMACSVKLVPYVKEQAITVPTSAVFTEELDEDKQYVYLAVKEGKPTKRPVTIGKKSDRRVEIVEGLQEGDEILLEKPGEPKKPALPSLPSKEAKP